MVQPVQNVYHCLTFSLARQEKTLTCFEALTCVETCDFLYLSRNSCDRCPYQLNLSAMHPTDHTLQVAVSACYGSEYNGPYPGPSFAFEFNHLLAMLLTIAYLTLVESKALLGLRLY